MSPFSRLLHELRQRHDLRQNALAEKMGYDKTYISAVEVGLKGPPTPEFIDRLVRALSLSEAERQHLHEAADASRRKVVVNSDIPEDAYWLLKELRERLHKLSPTQIRVIRDVLSLPIEGQAVACTADACGARQRPHAKQEATM
ncbi:MULTISPECIES: helix-turn-helix domain-containing protein [unclassified Delftia]|uniref:helix-turn-helix domain-containing protein n=1 Tax=unclassified Delftia TaxID=2613839 RepID=UPI0018FF3F99|nr:MULTISPECIES: helix-turn-helix transcriptional regulator [unclassified Delftia]MBK0110959.1 helix-turn-helix domain-containing protein [Delftia sp. S65]MBK0116291.1 helix-turn-helix domain-containing protein [Delftia sp. S67]MBK0129793.1 helix-turn-helix domain-containing protein [Delftia sp. S66]